MRAPIARLYQGLQAASAIYVLATLALPAPAAPRSPTPAPAPIPTPASEPAAETAGVAAPASHSEPVASSPPSRAPSEVVAASDAAEPRARPKATVGVNIPEGRFEFEPAGGVPPAFAAGGADAFPFAPPDPEPAAPHAGPPLVYRRGRLSGPLRVVRNPWSDPANVAFNQRGNAGRARAFAFDDRPEQGARAAGQFDSATVAKRWKRDVEQYRLLKLRGRSEEDLRQRLGERHSSVRWAASLDVGLDELPPPTDSYAAALSLEQKRLHH